MQPLVIDEKKSDFCQVVCEESGQDVMKCYQCGKCTAGCPIAFAMDLTPNQVMKMVQMGMEEDVLNSQAINLCAYCSTCTVRCPRNIAVADVMDSLRNMAGRKGIAGTDRSRKVNIFNQAFLETLKWFGRSYEIGSIVIYNLKSGQPFHSADLGVKMMQRGKIKLLPDRIKGIKEIKDIFQRINRLRKGA